MEIEIFLHNIIQKTEYLTSLHGIEILFFVSIIILGIINIVCVLFFEDLHTIFHKKIKPIYMISFSTIAFFLLVISSLTFDMVHSDDRHSRSSAMQALQFIQENKNYEMTFRGFQVDKPVLVTLTSEITKVNGIPMNPKVYRFSIPWDNAIELVNANPQLTIAMNP